MIPNPSLMEIVNRRLSVHEFKDYVSSYFFGPQLPNKLVVHHTWRPTVEGWAGQRTIDGLKRYYEGKGWTAGPHLFVAEDGIWLFSPMRYNGIHATSLNPQSIGIEVVGDYDQKRWEGNTKYNALAVLKILKDHLHIANEQLFFHRDVSSKSCPGWAITKEWLFNELAGFRILPRIPGTSTTIAAIEAMSAPVPAPTVEVMIPLWAAEAVAFVKQHQLFEIRTDEDVRDAVKFHRFYKLIERD